MRKKSTAKFKRKAVKSPDARNEVKNKANEGGGVAASHGNCEQGWYVHARRGRR